VVIERDARNLGDTMKKLTLSAALVGALATGFAGQATAADLPVKAPAPVVAVSSWTGLYIGGEVGAQWGDANWTTTCLGNTPAFCSPNGTPTAVNPFFIDASNPHTFHPLAARFGTYVGYNWQFAPNWLFGVEGNLGFAWQDGNKDRVRGIVGCAISCIAGVAGPGIDSSTVHMQWDGALRARLGYLATPDLLLYVAGGAAFQAVGMNVSCGPLVANPWCVTNRSVTNSDILPGWTVGAGLEYKYMRSWIFRAEYRYSEFNRFNTNFFQFTPDDVYANTKWRTQLATFGVSYLFNSGPAVVAKY
jgi:outer membrane immunogenic protein